MTIRRSDLDSTFLDLNCFKFCAPYTRPGANPVKSLKNLQQRVCWSLIVKKCLLNENIWSEFYETLSLRLVSHA